MEKELLIGNKENIPIEKDIWRLEEFLNNGNQVLIKARGKAISRAVIVATHKRIEQLTGNKELIAKLKASEMEKEFKNKQGNTEKKLVRVSEMEVLIKK